MEAMEKDVSGIAEGGGAEGKGAKRANTGEVRERLVRVGRVQEVRRKTTTLGAELEERKGVGRGECCHDAARRVPSCPVARAPCDVSIVLEVKGGGFSTRGEGHG